MISQVSARFALRNEFSTKARPKDPIGPNNFSLQDMFAPMGTFLAFAKTNPQDRASDIRVKAGYDDGFNKALVTFFSAEDEASYYAKIKDELGDFQTLESMLNIMTVQQQLDLIVEQFPAAWVWYGLRDSRYAASIPDTVKRAALQDPEWMARFGITPVNVSGAAPVDQIPMGNAPTAPGFKPAAPQNVAQIMKEASVSYTPKTPQSTEDKANSILSKWGVK